ncbi:glycosyltransferase, partial [Burkholderia sp. 8Y]|uniref:glycosyltransferase n=1 Tax=Burkholderia sp. 8Y TaxID=2653133 RepID=UPI00135704B1
GLPIVESMACGTPVVTSNCTAMPEIAGGAAILVDPVSVEEISVAAKRLLEDSQLRRTLAEKGVIRAREFKWSDVAAKVESVLTMLDVTAELAQGHRVS